MRHLVWKLTLCLFVGAAIIGPFVLAILSAKERLLADPVFRFPEGTRILIAGDSHMETAIDPANLPGCTNIASSSENYFYTYFKLRHFLNRNPGIRTILLGCGWHNFSRVYNESLLVGDRAGSMADYFPYLDKDGKKVIRRWSPDYLVPFLTYDVGLPIGFYKNKYLQKGVFLRSLSVSDITTYGGYVEKNVTQIKPADVRKKLDIYYGNSSSDSGGSPIMLEYIRKMIDLCEARSVRLILVNTPVHSMYREGVPEWAVDNFERIIPELTVQRNVQYVDLSGLSLPNSSFLDGDHVNRKGAEIVVKAVAEIIDPARENGL